MPGVRARAASRVRRRPKRTRVAARRVGLFGGTFDPPHVGHLVIAECARDQLRLDRVVFVPAGTPPHKIGRPRAPSPDRIAMTRLAVRGNPEFTVATLEARRRGPSFTIDTVREFRRRFPGARLYLLIGSDSLDDFITWREPDAIASLATLAVAGRPSRRAAARTPAARRARIVALDNPKLEVSSSGVRARVRRGRSIRYLVPDAVARYIARRRLYRSRP
jgi:nicotinate-nucleotide adenylyltransferase